MSKLKLFLLCFIIAFIFSCFLGLLKGAAFLRLLMRAVISGSVSAFFVLGAKGVLERYIPELFEKENEKELESVVQSLGNNLNISIDDEGTSFFGEDSGSNGPAEEYNTDGEQIDFSEKEEAAGAEAVQPLTGTSDGAENSKEENVEFLPVSYETNEGQPFVKKDFEKSGGAFDGYSEPDGTLEELPDLQEFEPVNSEGEKPEDFTESGTDSVFEADFSEGGVDSNLIAKAIQTVLRRES